MISSVDYRIFLLTNWQGGLIEYNGLWESTMYCIFYIFKGSIYFLVVVVVVVVVFVVFVFLKCYISTQKGGLE